MSEEIEKTEEPKRKSRKWKALIGLVLVFLCLGAVFSIHIVRIKVCQVTIRILHDNMFCLYVNAPLERWNDGGSLEKITPSGVRYGKGWDLIE